MTKIRVLHILDNLKSGGVQRFLLNLSRSINKENFEFTFIINKESSGYIYDELKKLNCKIFLVKRTKLGLSYFCNLKKVILQNSKFDIIHVHKNYLSLPDLFVAKLLGIKTRICHGHANYKSRNWFISTIKIVTSYLIRLIATDLWACSNESWEWLYKKDSQRKVIIKNLIQYSSFEYSDDENKKKLEEFDIKDKFVIVHVGRFTKEKNHAFLFEIFESFLKEYKNTVLLLIGDGPLLNYYKKIISESNLENYIYTFGDVPKVENYLSIADVFVLPSISEGLPLSVIEAQVNGLICLVSDVITPEIKISNRIHFLSLLDQKIWVNKLLEIKDFKGYTRNVSIDQSFNSLVVTTKVEKLYEDLYEKRR